jgi:diguanylate cyclase (GGDEF)-like protein
MGIAGTALTGKATSVAAAPLFLLSFRYRDELSAVAANAGWQSVAARRVDGVEQRFLASRASVGVVDARGAFEEGLAAARALADAVETNAAALLVLISRRDINALDSVIDAGATHYLASPFNDAEFAQALRFAERHAVRLAGGWAAAEARRGLARDGDLTWQADPLSGIATVSETLRTRLELPDRETRLAILWRLIPGEDRKAAVAAARRLRNRGRSTAFAHRLPGPEGVERVAHHIRLDAETGQMSGVIEPPQAEGERADGAGRDQLTGLRNPLAARRWIETRVTRGSPAAVLLLALTRFEMVNTAFGRETGDALLKAVARRIEPLVVDAGGKRALIARMAGAEFAVGLEGESADRAASLAQRLIEAVERPFLSDGHVVTLGCRIGIVEARDSDDATALLRRASAALAEAKTSENLPIRLLSKAEEGSEALDFSLQSDLRGALDRGEIEILFQPQVAITTGKIVGVEALARWRHPVHGELGAVTLFSVAEKSDYLLPLSAHVQKRAAEMAAKWPASLSALRLAINVTASDIARPGFADAFLAMIGASGFPRGRLTVEVTESGLIEDLNAAAGLLATLRAGGCRVAIDDFGTGYSSLAYLKALPLDYLKIDKRLAQDIAGSTRDRIVVRGVIDMARSLGLAVIAEGVETDEQLTLLAQEGCNYYQGFLCAEPLDVAALDALVRRS